MIYLLNVLVLLLGVGNLNGSSALILETTKIVAKTEQIKPCGSINIDNTISTDTPIFKTVLDEIYSSAPSALNLDLTYGDCKDQGCLGIGEDCIIIVTPGGGGGICYRWELVTKL